MKKDDTAAGGRVNSASPAFDIAYVAVFAGLIAAFGFLAIPVGALGVPIVLQNAAVILSGVVLGARRGIMATTLFLLIGMALPVLAGGRTTITAASSPTVGYLVGYLISAFIAGLIAYRAPIRHKGLAIVWLGIAAFVGLAIQYICGVIGLMIRSGVDFSGAWAAQVPFFGPDALKMVAVVAIAFAVHTAFPQLIRDERARS